MRWVPFCNSSSGRTLRRIWITLSTRTARLDRPTTMRNVLVNSTIGSSTAFFDSVSTTCQGMAEKASGSLISEDATRYDCAVESATAVSCFRNQGLGTGTGTVGGDMAKL